MLLSADSLTIIFVKIYCYWTRTVGVIAKGSRGPVFFETQCSQLNEYKEFWSAKRCKPWHWTQLSKS